MRRYVFIAFFVAFVLYFTLANLYYYRQRHLFDPYLQGHNPVFRQPIEKGNGVFRILCLGGSTTLCKDLPAKKRYPELLRAILQENHPSLTVEILNGSADWYATKHSLINYVTYGRDWKPDLIVVMHGINDLYRSFSPPKWAIGRYNGLWTHFYGPSIRGAKPPTFEQYLYWRLCAGIFKSWQADTKLKERMGLAADVDYPVEKYVSVAAFEKYLRTLIKYARDDKAQILLVTQPSLYKESMNREELETLFVGKNFCYTERNFLEIEYPSHVSLRRAMKAFNEVTKKTALAEGIMLADAAPRVPRNLDYFIDDCHYTEAGSALLAQLVAEEIIKSKVMDKTGE